MASPFEELFTTTAHDGASTPIGVLTPPPAAEVDQILAAWFRERHECIENRLLLDRVSRLLCRILEDEDLNPLNQRRLKQLIQTIRVSRQSDSASDT
jgi:hypothetical protein